MYTKIEKLIASNLRESLNNIALHPELVTDNAIQDLTNNLLIQYAKPVGNLPIQQRYYHNILHIKYMLEFFKGIVHTAKPNTFTSDEKACMILAILYHDVVYFANSKTNEEDSYDFFEMELVKLGIDIHAYHKNTIQNMILATKHTYDINLTRHEKLICDLDLLSLSWENNEFQQNSDMIRLEFGEYSDKEFFSGRKNWAENILARENIYYITEYCGWFEHRARENLQEMIYEINKMEF